MTCPKGVFFFNQLPPIYCSVTRIASFQHLLLFALGIALSHTEFNGTVANAMKLMGDDIAVGATNPSADSQSKKGLKAQPSSRTFTLPGIKINLHEKTIDLDATVCMDSGPLELVACGEGTKEHESIVALKSRAMHIHTALLLIGANHGHPAIRRPKVGESGIWENLPPKGDSLEVWFLITDQKDGVTEKPITEFVIQTKDRPDEVNGSIVNSPQDQERIRIGEAQRFPNHFLFAGSQLLNTKSGPRRYLADQSGNYISIATFGDEVLCLPFLESKINDALTWQIKPNTLPKVGTEVTLRLKLKETE